MNKIELKRNVTKVEIAHYEQFQQLSHCFPKIICCRYVCMSQDIVKSVLLYNGLIKNIGGKDENVYDDLFFYSVFLMHLLTIIF